MGVNIWQDMSLIVLQTLHLLQGMFDIFCEFCSHMQHSEKFQLATLMCLLQGVLASAACLAADVETAKAASAVRAEMRGRCRGSTEAHEARSNRASLRHPGHENVSALEREHSGSLVADAAGETLICQGARTLALAWLASHNVPLFLKLHRTVVFMKKGNQGLRQRRIHES